MELRCPSKILHGVLDDDVIEVACKSRWCGKRPGVVVIHRFSKSTGELIATRRFQEPQATQGDTDGHRQQGTPLRTA